MISKIKRNSWLQDIRMGEYAAGAVRWILILGAVLYLFYESLVPAVFLIPLSWIYVREWLEDTAKKKGKSSGISSETAFRRWHRH